jgi:hypothetical protein
MDFKSGLLVNAATSLVGAWYILGEDSGIFSRDEQKHPIRN